ncbi:hypothetical protein JXI42_07975 [bacterium]|nr:hypothetical protein [bacterium]
MVKKGNSPPKVSMTNTKKEMLEAYKQLLEKYEEKGELELKPEKKLEEKKEKEVIEVADSLSVESINNRIGNLKGDIGRKLSEIGEKLEAEINKYNKIKVAIGVKNEELSELYEIEKSAYSLAALMDTQQQKKEEFEQEMEQLRDQWEKEKSEHEQASKEQYEVEQKRRAREKEEYLYKFEREKQLTLDKYNDEMDTLKKQIAKEKEEHQIQIAEAQKEMDEREKVLSEREKDIDILQKKVDSFPNELTKAVTEAVEEEKTKLHLEMKNKDELLNKDFEGKKNVYENKIEHLEKLVKDQKIKIDSLSAQLIEAYGKIQGIAVKTVEGASGSRFMEDLGKMITEKGKKQDRGTD